MSHRLVLLGMPGAGKGTQAARLSQELNIPAISTGDIFRANVQGGTELGKEAQKYMDAGDLVPDSVTNAMVRDRLAQEDTKNGFLLDGYPRNPAQVVELDSILADLGGQITGVIEITADTDAVTQRLLKRAEIEGRADDSEDTIRHRLDVYEEQTAPVTARYAERNLVVTVDGLGEIDDVTQRILSALKTIS